MLRTSLFCICCPNETGCLFFSIYSPKAYKEDKLYYPPFTDGNLGRETRKTQAMAFLWPWMRSWVHTITTIPYPWDRLAFSTQPTEDRPWLLGNRRHNWPKCIQYDNENSVLRGTNLADICHGYSATKGLFSKLEKLG